MTLRPRARVSAYTFVWPQAVSWVVGEFEM